MKSISETMENIFAAVAFAEAGEFDTARRIAAENEAPVKAVTDHRPSHDTHGMIHHIPATES